MPSKPANVVASRLRSGSIQVGGSAAAPARAPQIEPTVAPLESVSQPPATTVVIAAVKSPPLRVRANASSAALLSDVHPVQVAELGVQRVDRRLVVRPLRPSSTPRRIAAA